MNKVKKVLSNEFIDEKAIELCLSNAILDDNGLFYGRLGISIFLYHYARYSSKKTFNDFADHLLEQVMSSLNTNTPINFAYGLTGIGWGINYLISNQFVQGDLVDVFRDIDSKLMEIDPIQMTDFSLETGLIGIIFYVLSRIKSCGNSIFDSIFLTRLLCAAQKYIENKNEIKDLRIAIAYVHFMKENELIPSFVSDLVHFVNPDTCEKNIHGKLGLLNGISGKCLYNILSC